MTSSEVINVKIPSNFPLNISNDLKNYSKIYISKEFNNFRTFHCFESLMKDYIVYGELPDGDKKILFTVKTHFQCCHCCDSCVISCCCIFDYVCCDRIMFQVDYQRNNLNFFTQGFNLHKGCYICKCYSCVLCCSCCCTFNTLTLRENTNPDDPNIETGIPKGNTTTIKNCFLFCQDKIVYYENENGDKEHTLRLNAWDIFKNSLWFSCTRCQDLEIDIEDAKGQSVGKIQMVNGCCSSKSPNMCFIPGNHFEIKFPKNFSSREKFQIIAEAIHFDLDTGLLI